MLSADGASTMAFFSSGSRALVEILTRMQSAERPMPVDHTFFEFGSIRYHVEASASDPENVYLSISTPSLSHEAAPSSTGLPEATLQETRKAYHKFAEVVEPPREGYVLTLKLNFSGLARPKDRVKAINQVSLLQSVVLSSQLRDMLGSLGPFGTMKLVYSQREPFFVSNTVSISLQCKNKN
jgi:actin related protein 2/3 complex subunit 2